MTQHANSRRTHSCCFSTPIRLQRSCSCPTEKARSLTCWLPQVGTFLFRPCNAGHLHRLHILSDTRCSVVLYESRQPLTGALRQGALDSNASVLERLHVCRGLPAHLAAQGEWDAPHQAPQQRARLICPYLRQQEACMHPLKEAASITAQSGHHVSERMN